MSAENSWPDMLDRSGVKPAEAVVAMYSFEELMSGAAVIPVAPPGGCQLAPRDERVARDSCDATLADIWMDFLMAPAPCDLANKSEKKVSAGVAVLRREKVIADQYVRQLEIMTNQVDAPGSDISVLAAQYAVERLRRIAERKSAPPAAVATYQLSRVSAWLECKKCGCPQSTRRLLADAVALTGGAGGWARTWECEAEMLVRDPAACHRLSGGNAIDAITMIRRTLCGSHRRTIVQRQVRLEREDVRDLVVHV